MLALGGRRAAASRCRPGCTRVAYPLVISGKPFFAWPAFVPITFELGVLGGALGAVFGMFALNRLPDALPSALRLASASSA